MLRQPITSENNVMVSEITGTETLNEAIPIDMDTCLALDESTLYRSPIRQRGHR
jgi:hypothetical protein